ncbi:MAG: protein kinase [Pirellulaceae bacterium]
MPNDDQTTDHEYSSGDGDSAEFTVPSNDALKRPDRSGSDEATQNFSQHQETSGTTLGGKYRLFERVGEGGMGTVWRAQQLEPVKRLVAVKLIKAGMDSKAVLSRFEAERQALAVMDHPNIARIYDGGVGAFGAPYFVMELVKGVSITEFCDARKLTLRQRLELFIPVCQAIQHAHQKGIIHRDIKPSNVLVTMVDDRPVPKVIDFGVAKATGAGLMESLENTGVNHVVGTPEYMSPEQASLNSLDIDTRSDVYSLGVLLYELLSGSTPFGHGELKKVAMLEILRIIREEDPPRPSLKLSTAGELPSLSANRSMEPKSLTSMLRLELDWIVMKALEKDRARRYETANAFASDIGRYLAGEAVLAHPPSRAYRIKKFLRKYKGPVLAGSMVWLALIAGVIGTAYGLARSNKQRILAQENQKSAEENQKIAEENYQLARAAVDRYLTQVGDNQLLNEPHMDGLRRELLESAKEFYTTFAENRRNDPAASLDLASAHRTLGEISWKIGQHEQAIQEIEASLSAITVANSGELLASELPASELSREYLQAAIRLASYFLQLGRFDESLSVLNKTLHQAERRRVAEPKNAELLSQIAGLLELRGTVYRHQNNAVEATADFQRAQDILTPLSEQFPSVHHYARDLTGIYTHLAQLAYQEHRDGEAEMLHRKALVIRRSISSLEPNSVEAQSGLAVCLSNLGGTLRRLNRLDEGTELLKEAVATSRQLVEEHPEIPTYHKLLASSLANLSVIYKVANEQELANEANEEAIQVLSRLSKQFPSVVDYALTLGISEGNEGNSRLSMEQFAEAIDWYERSNATIHTVREKSDDPRVAQVMRNNHWGRADAFMALKKFAEAIVAFDQAIALSEEKFKPELRLARAVATARSGDYLSASAVVESETASETADSVTWFDGAKVLAMSAEAALDDQTLAEEVRVSTSDELKSKAIEALLKAAELNYFKNERSLNELEQAAFALLSQRDDFKQLVMRLTERLANPGETP